MFLSLERIWFQFLIYVNWIIQRFFNKHVIIKMIKRSLTSKEYRAKECLELVHTNVCEIFNIYAWGYKYFITFTNDYYRFGYIYLMNRKSNALINSLNLKQNLKTNWVNISRHLDLIKVISIHPPNSILSLRSMRLYPNWVHQ